MQPLFDAVSLSANTIARRTKDIRTDIRNQFESAFKSFEWYSIAIDELSDVSDSAQVLLLDLADVCLLNGK